MSLDVDSFRTWRRSRVVGGEIKAVESRGETTSGPLVYKCCVECGSPTSYAKPYCTAHVLLMPYVRALV